VRFVLDRYPREPARPGRALNVRWLVDGQMLPGRGSVRVTVQLIDAAAARVRWSGAFQRPTEDIFAVISTVAESAATAIIGTLAPNERERLGRRPTTSNAALLAYTRGVAAQHHFDEPNLRHAVTAFEEAIAADSAFAPAWAALAESWVWLDFWVPPRQVYPRARAAAQRALALDPSSVAALTALALIAYAYDWDVPRAESLAHRVLNTDSARGRAWLYLAETLAAQGRAADAAMAYRRALAADTLDEQVAVETTLGLSLTRHSDQALALARRWRRLFPRSEAWDWAEALTLARARRCSADPPTSPITPLALACAGQQEAARALADTMVAQVERGEYYLPPGFLALAFASIGDREAALRWFARAVEARTFILVFAAVDPIWDDLRDDPRFVELLRQVRPAER
jgi:serine/threonine-protein kinase